ncbi:DUF4331 domain-containing protein [Occultella glacieicola]|uniref:DUF4331 domain-containing protein n=1 Tax=Occultella glacieicola TaxID=2518684 RepID=A0ABY2E1W9_9MICO|nr:DUF4331 family protein [Occultella glacieicola]TDE92592.1 DUF4331 domain-containing protein [Occultella glacieicola]
MSDHISGPRALADPIADITDVYAFPSPERPGWLVLVMNTMPFAAADGRFSDGLVYRFRLRPVDVDLADRRVESPHGAREWVLDCVFDVPGTAGAQQGRCTLGNGQGTNCTVADPVGGESSGIRMFAGPRWDPFIMDAPAGLRTIAEQRLSFTDPGSIFMDGKNVLSLVVEVDCAAVLGRPGPVGLVAETKTRGTFQVRIERVGRPEVKNLLLAPKQFDTINRDLEIRDLYNMEDGFHLGSSYAGAYRARLNANLAFWDGLDGEVHWPLSDAGTHPLTEMVLADYLVVDPTKPYTERGSFLEIERATREGRAHETCGGRSLNDDVMDVLYTLWINGGAGPVISDGVHAASRPASTTFPYLASANPTPPTPPAHV